MTDDAIVTTLQEILRELRSQRVTSDAQRVSVDAQLIKIHDLVNSQLTAAVNRFKEALETIEGLKQELANVTVGTAAESNVKVAGEVDPVTAMIKMLDATKAVAYTLLEQTEKMTALLIARRVQADTDQRLERRRIFP